MLVVDITDVTFIDAVGEEVLSFFGGLGAEFVAETSYSLNISERLRLCLVKSGPANAQTSCASRKGPGQRARRADRPVGSP